jgi:hypothetical protein
MARSRVRGKWLEAAGLLSLGVVIGFLLGAFPATGDVLDFETFAEGHVFDSDADLPGITFQVSAVPAGLPQAIVVFDSACTLSGGADPCTGGDFDLRTPGSGSGNTVPQGNVVIIPKDVIDSNHDGLVDSPDDSQRGGKVTLFFNPRVKLYSIRLIDIEEPQTLVKVEAAGGPGHHIFYPADFGTLQDNNAITIDLSSTLPAHKLEIFFRGSGAFDQIVFEASCGDGVQDDGEECDDGNTDPGDGCSPVCGAEDCGDGILHTALGEECDDGNNDPGDGCAANCLVEGCVDDLDCDDGLYCNGPESCDLNFFECSAGAAPCEGSTPVCDEVGNVCVECLDDLSCDDSLYCNGDEACVGGACVSGGSPCVEPAPVCDDDRDVCVGCLSDVNCGDGLFCNGIETCGAGESCQPGDPPCESGTPVCEEPDVCRPCQADAECDDGAYCNGAESCDLASGVCLAGSPPCEGLSPVCDDALQVCRACMNDGECSDGQFCNGAEICDTGGACLQGLRPCFNPTPACDEDGNACVPCTSDDDCTDGLYCNGPETCQLDGSCAPGMVPCTGATPICDEDDSMCVGCLSDLDCDDGLFCTGIESCDPQTLMCVFSQSPCVDPTPLCDESGDECVACLSDNDCDDGLFCTGTETCDLGSHTCQSGPGDPCASPTPVCDEAQNRCVVCLADGHCGDGVFCNGAEICNPITLTCDPPTGGPCTGDLLCDEVLNRCVGCLDDSDCDDGLFCNGAEICNTFGGTCGGGTAACTGSSCDESADGCVECLFDADCDDGVACTGVETCDLATHTCIAGSFVDCSALDDTCNVGLCFGPSGICVQAPKPLGTPCSDADQCTQADRCVSGVCTGVRPPEDTDCDGYADTIEEAAGCDPDDFNVIPTLATHYAGSRLQLKPGEAMVSWHSPRGRDVSLRSNAACDTRGRCGFGGFCERGRVADPCTVDADCALDENVCRFVMNFGNVPDMSYVYVRIRSQDLASFFPIYPGCAVKADVPIPSFLRKTALRLVIQGTTAGRPRKDRDVIRLLHTRSIGDACGSDLECDDGLFCNGAESCNGVTGTCDPGAPPDCANATFLCGVGTCDDALGCVAGDPLPEGSPCDDQNFCTSNDICVAGNCVGSLLGDTDGDGFCDQHETILGCDPLDASVTPPQAAAYAGSRSASSGEVLVTFAAPGEQDIRVPFNPSCAQDGICGPGGACTAGKVSDLCTQDSECDQPPSTCRMILNYAAAPDLNLEFARLTGPQTDVTSLLGSLVPGCARKIDLSIPMFPERKKTNFVLRITGTTDGKVRKDRDRIRFLRD